MTCMPHEWDGGFNILVRVSIVVEKDKGMGHSALLLYIGSLMLSASHQKSD